MIFITGPGHGGPAMVANTYLEGTYSELYPEITQDEKGLKKLFTQFSFPGGSPAMLLRRHPVPFMRGANWDTPWRMHTVRLSTTPIWFVACVIGDGEAETGPLATSWHSNKFLNPVHDGAVLPILHLNGYKIASPTMLARIPGEELEQLFSGYGYHTYIVAGEDPENMHRKMAETLDLVMERYGISRKRPAQKGFAERPRWPLILFRSPKGWTGPARWMENRWRVPGVRTRYHWPPYMKMKTTSGSWRTG